SISLSQISQKIHQEFTGDYSIPESQDAISQYMLLLDGCTYSDYWDFAHRRLRVSVFIKRDDYQAGHLLYSQVEAALKHHLPEIDVTFGGDFTMGFHWVDIAGENQVRSLTVSLILILLAGWLLLRSIRKSIVVAIPILIAIIVHFGTMGWLGIYYTIPASMMSSIILGISVDFSIHIQSAFYYYRKTVSPLKAIEQAFASTGMPILWTALIVALSFLTLMLSSMPPTQQLGLMVTLGMVCSAVASFLVVPVLIERR
ncbi:MAG: MMPL family transporter, partial [Candidatus Hydrogenedentes bacterium]|nr:MMPL family transporter [Candidatus Hydrogenedentota bacterium]